MHLPPPHIPGRREGNKVDPNEVASLPNGKSMIRQWIELFGKGSNVMASYLGNITPAWQRASSKVKY